MLHKAGFHENLGIARQDVNLPLVKVSKHYPNNCAPEQRFNVGIRVPFRPQYGISSKQINAKQSEFRASQGHVMTMRTNALQGCAKDQDTSNGSSAFSRNEVDLVLVGDRQLEIALNWRIR